MKKQNKLKPVKWGIMIPLIIFIFSLLLTAALILDNSLDRPTQLKVYGFIHLGFVLINFIAWMTSRSLIPISLILISMIMSLSYLIDYKGLWITLPVFLLFGFYFLILFFDIRQRAHYRRILELAAKPVHDKQDGFTPRPLPAGKLEYTRQDLMDFAAFLKRNRIAIPYIDDQRIMLAVKDKSRFWFGQPTEARDSYISFYDNGNVTVNIAKKDYKKYKDELTFDQLCQSLANLFKTYLVEFRDGKSDTILRHIREGS